MRCLTRVQYVCLCFLGRVAPEKNLFLILMRRIPGQIKALVESHLILIGIGVVI